jgi:hypothetical protein
MPATKVIEFAFLQPNWTEVEAPVVNSGQPLEKLAVA